MSLFIHAEKEYQIRWLGYTPTTRQPNLDSKSKIDNKWSSAPDLRQKEHTSSEEGEETKSENTSNFFRG